MKYTILKTASDIEALVFDIKGRHLYLVGAGEFGEMLGEYLNSKAIRWEGYIDKKGTGSLCEKSVFSYEICQVDDRAVYLITSINYAETISENLLDAGAISSNIFIPDSRRLVYELCSETNKLMKKMLEGSYREVSFGENDPQKTYMVLERSMIYEGIFSNVRRFMMGLDYADRNGFIPVIDQLYYPAFDYQNYEEVGIKNPWEYFFEQPGNVDMDYIKRGCKNVRFYNMDDSINVEYLSEGVRIAGNSLWRMERWNELARKYIRLNKNMQSLLDDYYGSLFPHNKNVVGVRCREGFSVAIEKKNTHGSLPFQPTDKSLIEDVKRLFELWRGDYIYLMCETQELLDMFRKEFGGQLIVFERERVEYSNYKKASDLLLDELHDHSTDKKKKAQDYIMEVYLLAKCNSLISGLNGATEVALMLNGEFENIKLYNNGYTNNFY